MEEHVLSEHSATESFCIKPREKQDRQCACNVT